MQYAEFHCVHLLYCSVQFEKIWGEAGTKRVGSRGRIRYLYAMYSIKVSLWLRRELGYLSAQASTDSKAGRLSYCPCIVLSSLVITYPLGASTFYSENMCPREERREGEDQMKFFYSDE